MRNLGRILWFVAQRVPFTLIMVMALLWVAYYTNSMYGRLPHLWLHRLGYSPRDLVFVRWDRLFTSAFVTDGGHILRQAICMILLGVGLAEYLGGTRWAFAIFWSVHIMVLMGDPMLITYPLHWDHFTSSTILRVARDVGPSVGYYACMGLATVWFPKYWRWIAGGGLLLGLIIFFWWQMVMQHVAVTKSSSNLAHILAVALAWLIYYTGRGLRRNLDRRRMQVHEASA